MAGASQITDWLSQFTEGLVERDALESQPAKLRVLDRRLANLADRISEELIEPIKMHVEPPPRRVAVAMGLSLHTAPHFSTTFPAIEREGTVRVSEPDCRPPLPPMLVSTEVGERALGLAGWELDELREEIDRRAGRYLKQSRAIAWLWRRFGLPKNDPNLLFRAIFPGTSVRREVAWLRRGGHIYGMVDQLDLPPPQSLFLPWLAPDPEFGPASAFRSRAVDVTLVRQLGRSIGADEAEVEELLESSCALLPRSNPSPFLLLDQWRTSGLAMTTDLACSYAAANWLTAPLPPDSADWRAWIRMNEGGLSVKGPPHRIFDSLALPRIQSVLRQIYALMLADLDHIDSDRPTAEDIAIYDLPGHFRSALGPLLSWTLAPETHAFIAHNLGRSTREVESLMIEVHRSWLRQAGSSWCGEPAEGTPSIQTLCLQHVLVLHRSLRGMFLKRPDPRAHHHDMLVLFAAHYLREAPLERLWVKQQSDCIEDINAALPPPEDIIGHWFWCVWLRMLDYLEDQATISTYDV